MLVKNSALGSGKRGRNTHQEWGADNMPDLPEQGLTLFLGWDGKVHINNPRFAFGYAICGYFHLYPLRASRHLRGPSCPGCQGRQQTWEDLPYG